MASETRTNHRGLSSSHSASVWARLETLLQGRLCLLNCGQQAQQPGTRPWEGGTPGLPGHFPEPCGVRVGRGRAGSLGKGAGTAAQSEDVPSSCRDPWTQEVSMGQDFAGCSSVFIWVGSGACVFTGADTSLQGWRGALDVCPWPLGSGGPP